MYQRDYAEDEVLVCIDETNKQHTKETRIPLPTQPGHVEKFDYEYERNGVSSREARLSRLCAAVVKQIDSTVPCGLRLPGIEIDPSFGAQHQRILLKTLALFEWDA